MIFKLFQAIVVARRGKMGHVAPVSSISCRFVLQEVVQHTKYCCSLKVKVFGPSQNFGLATPLFQASARFM